jgi:DNA-binding transcriptional ArsR family regulator
LNVAGHGVLTSQRLSTTYTCYHIIHPSMRIIAYNGGVKRHRLAPKQVTLDLEAVLETFKALSEEPRIRLVLALSQEEKSVNDLVAALELPQSTVSRHLATLRNTELVTTRREGTQIFYKLKSSHIADLVVQAFAHAEHERRGLPDHPKGKR